MNLYLHSTGALVGVVPANLQEAVKAMHAAEAPHCVWSPERIPGLLDAFPSLADLTPYVYAEGEGLAVIEDYD